MEIIVTGSIAYDHIMDFPGYFKDHVLPEKVHMLNISFLVNSLKKLKGGCACNIAYNLSLLEKKPAIMGTVGVDFEDYRKWLECKGVDTSFIKVIPDEFTATCFVTTDFSDNQIIGFYPGAMSHAKTLTFLDLNYSRIKLAVISANDPEGMKKYVRECKALSIPYMFDPGHQIPRLDKEDLADGINGAQITIVNDYEFQMAQNKTGFSLEKILEGTKILIITKGQEGSVVYSGKKACVIPPAKANEVADPTGAGDAYRAGVIKGWLEGRSLEEIGKLGSIAAVYAVEKYGTTEHSYTPDEFEERMKENFPELTEEIAA